MSTRRQWLLVLGVAALAMTPARSAGADPVPTPRAEAVQSLRAGTRAAAGAAFAASVLGLWAVSRQLKRRLADREIDELLQEELRELEAATSGFRAHANPSPEVASSAGKAPAPTPESTAH